MRRGRKDSEGKSKKERELLQRKEMQRRVINNNTEEGSGTKRNAKERRAR